MNYVPIDYARSCRLCLSDRGIKIPIFEDETDDTVDVRLPSKILTCVSIKVKKGDPYPPWICLQCQVKIEDIYEFRRLCRLSDVKLKTDYDILLRRKNLELLDEIEKNEDKTQGSCMVYNERAITNTFIEDRPITPKVHVKPEPIELSFLPISEDGHPICVKQECEDMAIEQTDESAGHVAANTSMAEEYSESKNQNPVFSVVVKQEIPEQEITEMEQPCRNEDYNPPLQCVLKNEASSENGSEVEKQHLQPQTLTLDCPICGCPFTSQRAFYKHAKHCTPKGIQRPNPNKGPACRTCRAVLSSYEHLVIHEKVHRRITSSFECNVCSIVFKQKGELICHQAQFHRAEFNKNLARQTSFTCDNCGKVFNHKGEYILHKEFHHHTNSSRLATYRQYVKIFPKN